MVSNNKKPQKNSSISDFKPIYVLLLKMSAFNYVVLIFLYCSLNKFNLEILRFVHS